ncbi:unnamed protein product [Haemonchus placei]|uniref:MFS domain-containing protein n=1 Tax=Haemonchus placei TaxID=6290 RepID=A0A0N4VZ14_HAEPC|nr:unnamed protein product [Haemonchus placei]
MISATSMFQKGWGLRGLAYAFTGSVVNLAGFLWLASIMLEKPHFYTNSNLAK